MKKAGVLWIFMGVESISNDTLDHFDKRQTIEKVRKSIDMIRRHGMHVCASFVLGSDDDTKDTWRKNIQFAQESGATWVMLNILTDFHNGQEEELIPSHRVFQKNWDYYTTHFVTHYPKYMRPSELERKVIDGYRLFFSWRNILTNLLKGRVGAAFFQLYRSIVMKPHLREMEAYIPQLKQIEEDMYDASDHLMEEKLLPVGQVEESDRFHRPMQQDHAMIFPMAS
ncbi:MAG: hypothetical protein HY538_00915 [Deltaproteobacteria bacterium]|nr:hypothetical protein [Deltaproteobacteria bacterium]